MDILILSGLAYIGHELSKKIPDKTRNVKEKGILKKINTFPIKDDNLNMDTFKHKNFKKQEDQIEYNNSTNITGDVWSVNAFGENDHYSSQFMSVDSKQEKLIEEKLVPFFSSTKVQNTNTNLKERRLETFTGINENVYNNKKEVANMFKPSKMVFHNKQSNKERLDRYKVSGKMDGVSPIEKTYVGPGLNVGTDVSAKGGFHDTFRILPENHNSYVKQSFKGRVIPGKAQISNRNFEPLSVEKNRPERIYTMEDRPAIQTTGAYKAYKAKENFDIKANNRTFDNNVMNHNVNLNGFAQAPPKPLDTKGEYTMEKEDENCNNYRSGLYSNIGTGGYTVSKILVHESDREMCGSVSNVQNKNAGVVYHNNDPLNKTLRETTEHNKVGEINIQKITNDKREDTILGYIPNTTIKDTTQNNKSNGFISNSELAKPGHVNTNYNADPTHRQGTSVEYSGIIKGSEETTNRDYKANQTHREGTSTGYSGSAIYNSKATLDTTFADNSQMYHKREDTLIGYSPGPTNINNLDDPDNIVNAEFKFDNNKQKINQANLPNNVPTTDVLGIQNNLSKIDENNSRFDTSLIVDNNPYVKLPVRY